MRYILLVYLLCSYSHLYAEISVIPDREYFATVHELLEKAKSSIDPKIVANLIMLVKIYGEEAVTEAIDRATRLSFANGKWELRYIIGILKEYRPRS